MNSQLLLNGMLPPLKEFDRGIKANKDLEDQEKINLYQISCDCMNKGAAYNIKAALTDIAISYGKYFKQGKTLPFLLRQVIFCLTVHCLKYNKMNQKQVIEYLKKNGVTISHNFISRAKIKPTDYWKAYECDIPDPPVEYMGQKKGELGAAIRNLVYQAREYNTFIDLFGGSGAASAAVMHLRGKNYIYNEVNPNVYHLFYFLATDYKRLLEAITELQNYICLSDNYPKKDNVLEETQMWIDGRIDAKYYEPDRELMLDGTRQGCCMVCLYYFTHYPLQPLEQAVGEVFRRHFSFLGNVDVSSALSKMRGFYDTMGFTGRYYEDLMEAFHKAIENTQCMNNDCLTLIKAGEKMHLYYVDPPYVATSEYEKVEIKKKSKKNQGIFTDTDTEKFEEESNSTVGKFTDKEMENLIKKLITSGGKFIYSCRAVRNKTKEPLSKKELKRIRSGNKRIYESVFNIFKQKSDIFKQKSDIYVLAIENFVEKDKNKDKTLGQRIQNHEVVELMITNYEIHSFTDLRYPNTIFRVYDFDTFLSIWDQNALV